MHSVCGTDKSVPYHVFTGEDGIRSGKRKNLALPEEYVIIPENGTKERLGMLLDITLQVTPETRRAGKG